MGSSPTQRTLKQLREAGYVCDVAERRLPIPGRHVTVDLFGFIDVVALSAGCIIGIQCTTGSNAAARVKKIVVDCADDATAWLRANGVIEVWGWRKLKRSGGKWEPRIVEITLEDIEAADAAGWE